MTLTLDEANAADFWRALAPELHLEGDAPPPDFALDDAAALVPDLLREGYVNAPGAFAESQLVALRGLITTLAARGIPAPFAFVYDEPWALYTALHPFLAAVLGEGYRALPDFWAWHVAADDDARGWGPHRDRMRPTVGDGGWPMSLTVWLPLSDATPLNGCIYALPAHLDPVFAARAWDAAGNTVVHKPQDIRCLAAPAGSLLAWNQSLLHWGGRASRRATAPRVSLAFEFQRGDRGSLNQPLLDPSTRPTLRGRLGLIGKMVLQYSHMYPLAPETSAVAQALRRHMLEEFL